VIYEVRKEFNKYLGYFVEIVDTTVHPKDCTCVECKPRPARVYRERDDKEDRLFWK
jgi:hypothetical protein